MSEFVEVRLRIDRRNLAALTAGEKVPVAYHWLERNDDGTYALCADAPIGDVARRGMQNHQPGSKLSRMSKDEKADLARRWEAEPGIWGAAIDRAIKELRS